ncbi:MAG TPA: DinB family protein [Phycisphaerales bacterium]|nr:DinB family protein [Phycisphaerales bacterium]
MDPLKIYDYLLLVRERIFNSVRSLSEALWLREFPIGLKSIGATLTHIMISEWYYIERLQNRAVPHYNDWPIKYESPHTPPFTFIEPHWREQGTRIRSVIASEPDWPRTVTWLGFPDDTRNMKRFRISATAGDLFTQLALHETHHRAQVMMMLRELGPHAQPVEDVDYNALMFERVEVTTPSS